MLYAESQILLSHLIKDVEVPDHLLSEEAMTARKWILSYKNQYGKKPSPESFSEKFNVPLRDLDPYDEILETLVDFKAAAAIEDIEGILGDTRNPRKVMEALLEKAREFMDQVGASQDKVSAVRDGMDEFFNDYRHQRAQGIVPHVARFGFPTLDDETNGFERGDVIVLCARLKAGKSTWARHVAINNLKDNKRTVYFALEENVEMTLKLFYSYFAQMPSRGFLRNNNSQQELSDLIQKTQAIKGLTGDILVPHVNVSSTLDILRYLDQHNPDLFILDQLSIFAGDLDWKVVTKQIYKLKNDVCMKTGIPALVLTQDNRKGITAYADGIEAAADKVLRLSKDPESPTELKTITVERNRRGAFGGVIPLRWEPQNSICEELGTAPVNVWKPNTSGGTSVKPLNWEE